jgi:hypothetical protein
VKRRLERIGVDAVMALAAINLWTGSPLLALWVGSQVVSSSQVTMGAVALVAVTMLATSLVLIAILGRASAAHDRLTGRTQTVRRHVPWLRSMRDERVDWERNRATLTALDRLLVAVVVLAILLFEAWFFITDPSPISPGPAKDY